MPVPILSTIGYEGAALEPFVATLLGAGVELVVDVRAVVSSRKPGFSKNALHDTLTAAGIDYTHARALGTPKEGRQAARRGDRATFIAVFDRQLESPEAQMALEQVADLAGRRHVCLMCFERDPALCHRTLVAARIGKRRPVDIQDLSVST